MALEETPNIHSFEKEVIPTTNQAQGGRVPEIQPAKGDEKKTAPLGLGDEILTLEIPDSKFKSKSIYFNPFWNCFFLIDSEEQLWMLEFFPPVYFQNYWTNFEYLESNQLYIEREDEFDRLALNKANPPNSLDRFRAKFSRQANFHPANNSDSNICSAGLNLSDEDVILAVINNQLCES